MHNLTNNWTWVAYSAGAAGKIICNIIQQSKQYDKWYSKSDTADLDAFCKTHMPTKLDKHLSKETNQPYKLNWYTREMPYTRGDNLSVKQVNNYIVTHDPKIEGKKLVLPYTKTKYPKWFAGKIVQIVNDKDSIDFLRNRRDQIFYKWLDSNRVNFLQRDPKYHPKRIQKIMQSYKDTPPHIEYYQSKEHFHKHVFYNNEEIIRYSKKIKDKRIVAHINFSDIINNNLSAILRQLQDGLETKITKSRAKIILDNWQLQNQKLF